jgi:hypothetical protein
MFVNSEQNEHAPMDYHAQTTYATNQMIHAKTQPPIAFHQMTHVQQINALSFLVGVNSVVVPHWKSGRGSAGLPF